MTEEQRELLQKHLSGMKAGFTLTDDGNLYIRFSNLQFGFTIFEIRDSSRIECYCCGEEITTPSRYYVEISESFPFCGTTTREEPLCPDCGCPK